MYCIDKRPPGVKEIRVGKTLKSETLEVEMEDGVTVVIEPTATTVYPKEQTFGTRVPHSPSPK